MAPKSVKKHHSVKNPHQNRQKTNANRNRVRDRTGQNGPNKRVLHHEQITPLNNKKAPKPPQNGYFVWGRHAVFAALANPERRIQKIYAVAENTHELEHVLGDLDLRRKAELPRAQMIDRARLDAIGGVGEKAVHQGIAAAVWPLHPPHFDIFLDDIKSRLDRQNPTTMRLLLLDQISDPHNFGAIMRSARAFGVTGIITTFRNAASENGVLARAASGALDHVPLIRVVNLARAIEQIRYCGFFVAGLAGDGNADVSSLGQHNHLAIILGAEGSGLRRLSRDHCDVLVRINIDNNSESLNVSNAAAVALYAASLR
jgi:23S rRNA (guanosine2251-2'-O)-methyltransferase